MNAFPSPHTAAHPRRFDILTGLVFWTAISVAAVCLRGLRWDETLEWAQVITGDVVYPTAHPLNRFVWSAYTIQHFASAAMLWTGLGELSVNGLRNVLYLLAGIVPLFLLVSHLTGRVWAGHGAVVLALQGVFQHFETVYPIRIWPHSFSNGPIGTGCVLLALYLLIAGKLRAAALLFCLLPIIHIGQIPPLMVVVALFLAWTWLSQDRRTLRSLAPYAGPGVLACAVLAGVLFVCRVPAPVEGGYFSEADALVIWKNYMQVWPHFDISRGLKELFHSQMAVAGAGLFGGAAGWLAWKGRIPMGWFWLSMYCLAVAAIVWGAMILHTALGPDIPRLAIIWMPYRLANHTPVLLVALCLGILAWPRGDGSRKSGPLAELVLLGILAMILLGPVIQRVIGDALYLRYFENDEWAVFALVGLAWPKVFARLRPDRIATALWSTASVAYIVFLALNHQFGTACIVAGLGLGIALERPRTTALVSRATILAPRALAVTAALLLLATLHAAYESRASVPPDGFDARYARTPFDERVAAYLEERGESDAMLVGDNFGAFVQARTGHPVMAQWMTGAYSIYTPQMGPPIQKMFREIYGIAYGESPEDGRLQQPETWQRAWSQREPEAWQSLGRAYGFRYIIAPPFVEPKLPLVLEEEGLALYEIPDADSVD